MEEFPFVPFESEQKPEKTGSERASKKKRRTTKIPLPVVASMHTKEADAVADKKDLDSTNDTDVRPSTVEATETLAQERSSEYGEGTKDKIETSYPGLESVTPTQEYGRDHSLFIERGESIDASEVHEPRVDFDEVLREEAAYSTAEKVSKQEYPVNDVIRSDEKVSSETALPYEPPLVPLLERPQPLVDQEQIVFDNITPLPKKTAGEVSKQEHEQTIDRVRRRATSRGVLAGGLAGWWLGKRKGRTEAEKEAHVVLRSKDIEVNQLTHDHKVALERLKIVERAASQLPSKHISSDGLREPIDETLPLPRSEPSAEVVEIDVKKELITTQMSEAIAADLQKEAVDTQDRRLEKSAWHTYEVDAKTGRLIEEQSFEYGEEFKREKKAERLRREAMQPRLAIQVGHTLLGDSNLQPNDLTPTQDESAPVPEVSKTNRVSTEEIKQQLLRQTTNPVTWIAAGLLVVLLFVAGAIR